MIYYRSSKMPHPQRQPFRLALSDAVLGKPAASPWNPGSKEHAIYTRTFTAAVVALGDERLTLNDVIVKAQLGNLECEACGRFMKTPLLCAYCGTILCDNCDLQHHCPTLPEK